MPINYRKRCTSTFRLRWTCVVGFTFFGLLSQAIVSQAQIPPRPAERQFLHDLAGTIGDAEKTKIRALQEKVFNDVQVPLVVVTINRMQEYDPGAPSIESFARRWFDAWGIGSQQKNDGILLIVSTGDRKGRIELGASWGSRFDGYCLGVMNNDMIPHFKTGDYSGGIVAGVEKLVEMAEAGPRSQPPAPGLGERFRDATGFVTEHNPIAEKVGPFALIVMFVAGLACLVAAYFIPDHRETLIIAGVVLIALVLVFWLVMLVFAFIMRGRGGGGSGGGFGGGSGGGFSGGGGASGSW